MPRKAKPKIKTKPAPVKKKPAKKIKEKEPEEFTPPFSKHTDNEAEVLPVKEPRGTKQVQPSKGTLCGNCHHDGEMHYGSDTNWCNMQKCRCEAFEK